MTMSGIKPNRITYNILISSCAKALGQRNSVQPCHLSLLLLLVSDARCGRGREVDVADDGARTERDYDAHTRQVVIRLGCGP